MTLPNIKNIKKVVYCYKDCEYYLEGEDVKEFFDQVISASMMAYSHGTTFKELNWKKKQND
jgi:hypothetical protein